MWNLGSTRQNTCQGHSRRELLQLGGCAALGLTLTDALRAEESRRSTGAAGRREKSCILFWLSGGPSQHETFDPKPDQPAEIRGPYGPLETNVSGIQICSLLPQLARQADKYTILRSLCHDNPNHSFLPMMNGGAPDRTTYGAVVTRFGGSQGAMPPYVHLGSTIDLGAGVLGAAFNPVEVTDPRQGPKSLPDFSAPDRVTDQRFARRRRLVSEFDSLRAEAEGSSSLQARDAVYQRAVAMLTTPAVREAFDLTRELAPLRARYGASIFGQSCLLARRLVEAGSRFIQVQWSEKGGGVWDTHGTVLSGIFEMEQYLCPRFDQGMSALLFDLHDRGLLEDTIVLAIAEFGRTPRINNRAGRDHWPHVFSALIAGGGIPGGTVVGSSDQQGGYPGSQPIRPGDLAATLYHKMGLDPLLDVRIRPYVTGSVVPELA